jgi:hypothetical protein
MATGTILVWLIIQDPNYNLKLWLFDGVLNYIIGYVYVYIVNEFVVIDKMVMVNNISRVDLLIM